MTAPTEAELAAAAAALGEALREHGWRLSTAESSTGGLIGHAITMIPGASDYYVGGVIAYSNLAKEIELGVAGELIAEQGAVSEAVAAAMAAGVCHRLGTEVGLAVTGIAGPEGGTAHKPVGTHHLAVAVPGHPPVILHAVYPHDRDGNRAAAALAALQLATAEVRRHPTGA